MSIEFSCDSCGKHFSVDDSMAGRRFRCKACKAVVQAPKATADADRGAHEPDALPFDFELSDAMAIEKPKPAPPPLPMTVRETPPKAPRAPRIPVGRCPGCGGDLPATFRVCPNCKYDARTGAMPSGGRGGVSKALHFVRAIRLIIALVALVAVVVAKIGVSSYLRGRSTPNDNVPDVVPRSFAIPENTPRPVAMPVGMPIYPQGRPSPLRMDQTVIAYPMRIGGTGPGLPMDVRLFFPIGAHLNHSLPCVFIAPAGTRLIHGSALGEGNPPEYLPYVHAGFAVLAYELSGDVPNDNGRPISYATLREPMRQFMNANGGLDNVHHAVEFVLTAVPEVDPNRLFAAGHSSAGTMALNAAANDHRFRAVAAYAPVCDVLAHFGDDRNIVEGLVPGGGNFLLQISPIRHIAQLMCPVLVFHADDDSRVPISDNQSYVRALQGAGRLVQFTRVNQGDHYDSMIRDGIPAGIQFFMAHGAAGPNAAPSQIATGPNSMTPGFTPRPPRPAGAQFLPPSVQTFNPVTGQDDSLAPEVRVGSYTIRPPMGFTLEQKGIWWIWTDETGSNVMQVGLRQNKSATPATSPTADDDLHFHPTETRTDSAIKCSYTGVDGDTTIVINLSASSEPMYATLKAAAHSFEKRK